MSAPARASSRATDSRQKDRSPRGCVLLNCSPSMPVTDFAARWPCCGACAVLLAACGHAAEARRRRLAPRLRVHHITRTTGRAKPAGQSRRDPRRGAAARAAEPLRQPAVHGARPATTCRRPTLRPYKERGIASWYGRKFHGQKTSIGETYDMYAMTAAHPTLPLPSYARVTNVANGKSVIVRVNDRGPFLHGRIIDLSYAAAHRIGIAQPRAAARSRSRRSSRRQRPCSRPRAAAAGRGGADTAARPPPARRSRADRAARTAAASRCSSVRSQNYANAQTFLDAVQSQLAERAVEPEGAPGGRPVSRLRRALSGPRRGEARRRSASRARSASRRRWRRIEASSNSRCLRSTVRALPVRYNRREPSPHARADVAMRGGRIATPTKLGMHPLASPAHLSLSSRCSCLPLARARPAHHRDRRRRGHRDPDRHRAVRRRAAWPLGISGIVGADLARSGLFRLVDTAASTAAGARGGRAVRDWRARGADAVVVGLDAAAARRPRRGALRAGRRRQADAAGGDGVHGRRRRSFASRRTRSPTSSTRS